MRMKRKLNYADALRIIGLILLVSFVNPPEALGQEAVIRSVLFYSPTCPHCHEVITQTLPPLIDSYGGTSETVYIPPAPEEEHAGPSLIAMYGDTLEILYVNTLTKLGYDLYSEAVDRYQIPSEGQVVPLMIINDSILTGGNEIPSRFSEFVDAGIAAGGIDWPSLPGLGAAISNLVDLPVEEGQAPANPLAEATSVSVTDNGSRTPSLLTELTILDKIRLDPIGNGIAILVLVVMLAILGYVGTSAISSPIKTEQSSPSYLIPILCLSGIMIAGYLIYVETSGDVAFCGPIGDCNVVQQSQYSRLFGIIPIGITGMFGYISMGITWLFARFSSKRLSNWANFTLFAMASVGILFSIYLTFLEPFVIGATCAWCLGSAVIMTLLFWLSKDNGRVALNHLRG
jgi:uncharacterized membrane protein